MTSGRVILYDFSESYFILVAEFLGPLSPFFPDNLPSFST